MTIPRGLRSAEGRAQAWWPCPDVGDAPNSRGSRMEMVLGPGCFPMREGSSNHSNAQCSSVCNQEHPTGESQRAQLAGPLGIISPTLAFHSRQHSPEMAPGLAVTETTRGIQERGWKSGLCVSPTSPRPHLHLLILTKQRVA